MIRLLLLATCQLLAENSVTYTFKNKKLDNNTQAILKQYAHSTQAKIAFFEKQNLIAITDDSSDTCDKNDIIRLAKKLDKYEAVIEIEILFISTKENNQNRYGFDWFGIYNKNHVINNFGFKGIGGALTDYPTPTKPINNAHENLFVNPSNFNISLTNNFLDSLAGLKLPITFGDPNLNTRRLSDVITTLSEDNRLRILDKTNIVTKNCKSAKFEFFRAFPIYSLKNIQNTNEPLHQKYSVQYKNSGVRIKIKPRVICEKFIELEIFYDLTELIYGGKHRKTLHHEFGQIILDPPVYKLFRIKQKVTLASNESTIISTNLKNTNESILKKVPFLSTMPILGKIFTSQDNVSQNIEEFILITPRIIVNRSPREIA